MEIHQLMLSQTENKLSIKSLPKMQSLWAQRFSMVFIGAIYPLGFAPFGWWIFSLLSVLLLINEVVVRTAQPKNSQNQTSSEKVKIKETHLSLSSMGFYWGIGAFGVGVSWVYVSIHEFGHAPVPGAIAISLLFVVTLSSVKAGGFYLIDKMATWFGKSLMILIIPFAWVVSEFIQTSLFSGFPWLFAGYSQIDGPLWMLSTWIGVYGVSWFILAIASCLVLLLRQYLFSKNNSIKQLASSHNAYVLLVLISVPVLSVLIRQPEIIPDKKSLNVALVQPNIPQEKKWDRRYFSQIVDVLYQQSEKHWDVDLLVWPEGAIPAYKHQVEDIILDLNSRSNRSGTDLLFGLPIYHANEQISYASFISAGKYKQNYHKQVLVPFGEYMPLGDTLRGMMEFFDLPMSNFSPATSEQFAMEFDDYQVIPAICYEITYPSIVQDLISKADKHSDKAKLLVTVSNDAWFGDSFGPYQHMEIARMRALESGIPLVRSTNDGITAVVDARGNLIKKLDRYTQDTLRYEISLTSYDTLYRRFGLLGIYGLLMMSVLIFVISWFSKRKGEVNVSQ